MKPIDISTHTAIAARSQPVAADEATHGPSRAVPFTRKAQPVQAHAAQGASRAGAVSEDLPLKRLAQDFTAVCSQRQAELAQRGVSDIEYLGSDRATWVYSNSQNGEAAITNIRLGGDGLLSNIKVLSRLLVKPDGRVFYNGEPVNHAHPKLGDIQEALVRMQQMVADDKLMRISGIGAGGNAPPWKNPDNPFNHYVP